MTSDLDALGQAAAVARGDVSPAELLEVAIARAEARNPDLNFMAHTMYERARQATKSDFSGPFAGVPFLVKDLHLDIAGERSGEGSRLWDGYKPASNSTLYDRFVAAGLNTFGKTTTPELGLTVTTESKATGLTRNPWDVTRSAGGSSGGAACAVASGVVPIAHASDGGGSIRCPASACGVFGMKPSRGRVPLGPRTTENWLGLSTAHAVSRSVRDSAALLDAIHGCESGSRYVAPPPVATFLSEVSRQPGRLRVALMLRPPTDVPVDPEVKAATMATGQLLEALGHHVEEAQPALAGAALGKSMGVVIGACTALEIAARLSALGRDDCGDDIENLTQMFVHIGEKTTALQLLAANDCFQNAAIVIARFMEGYDVILSPVFAHAPIELGKIDLSQSDSGTWASNLTAYSPFTGLYNQTGQPAMSIPLAWSESGLPIGMMFAGRYGSEGRLFRLAGQLERAAPWAERRPPVGR
jgi:amidase